VLDVTGDFLLFDNLVTVTVSDRDPDDDSQIATYGGVRALRVSTAHGVARLRSDGEVLTVETTWHLYAEDLGGYTPKRRDRIEVGAEVWSIDSVDVETLASRFVCKAHRVP
jgi:hypothetical protein